MCRLRAELANHGLTRGELASGDRCRLVDVCGHFLTASSRRRNDPYLNLFRQLVFQISFSLEQCIFREIEGDRSTKKTLRARLTDKADRRLAERERRVAAGLFATKACFETQQFWSLATDAARAGQLNRQNTMVATDSGAVAWAIPVV